MDRGLFANWLSLCRAFSASPSFCVYLGLRYGRNRPSLALLSCPRNKHVFRRDQNGPPARRKEGAYPERYVTDPAAAGQPPAHFHRNPPGRGQLAVFPRCSLLTYRSRYARRSRLEKQPTDLRRKTCLFRGQDNRILEKQKP